MGIDELQPLQQLASDGLSHPERDVFCHCCAIALLLRPDEHLGPRLPVGPDRLQLQDLHQPHQREWLVWREHALLRKHF